MQYLVLYLVLDFLSRHQMRRHGAMQATRSSQPEEEDAHFPYPFPGPCWVPSDTSSTQHLLQETLLDSPPPVSLQIKMCHYTLVATITYAYSAPRIRWVFSKSEKPVLCNNTCQQVMPTDEYSKNKFSTQVSEIGMFPSTWTLRWRYALPGQFSTHLSDSLVEDSTIKIQHWCDK